VSKPEWKGRGDVVGCGLVFNPGVYDGLAIFFTLNGTLLGQFMVEVFGTLKTWEGKASQF
jgi:hypothetical protein